MKYGHLVCVLSLVMLLSDCLLLASSKESIDVRQTEGVVVQTSVKLNTPKDGKDKRVSHPLDEVSCSIFLPHGVEVLRGAVYNPFYEDTVYQEHWRTVVKQWKFGLIGTNLFRVKNDEIGSTVLNSLKKLAVAGGHPETENLPLCVLGMSIGAGLTTRIVEAVPDRVIAAGPVCLEVGPRDPDSYRVPMVTIFGEKDGRQMEILRRKLPEARLHKAQWAIAVQWRRRHEWYRANNLIMPFFDRVIRMRCPRDELLLNGCVELRELENNDGWLGDISTWNSDYPEIASVRNLAMNASEACWLPDQYIASVWQAFVVANPKFRIIEPPGQGDGEPFQAYPSNKLPVARLEVDEGVSWKRIELFDGDRLIGSFSGSPLTCPLGDLTPGIHALIAMATLDTGQKSLSHANTIVVVDSK